MARNGCATSRSALDVAYLRGTTADDDGNITMEQEAIPGEMLSTAQAVRRCGRHGGGAGQAHGRSAARCSAPMVKIPGILVDYVVVGSRPAADLRHRSTTRAYAGELRVPLDAVQPLPFGLRKVIARRAAMELRPGAVCNLGAGISTGISAVAAEEGILTGSC